MLFSKNYLRVCLYFHCWAASDKFNAVQRWIFRRIARIRLQNPPWAKLNLPAFASAWKYRQTLIVFLPFFLSAIFLPPSKPPTTARPSSSSTQSSQVPRRTGALTERPALNIGSSAPTMTSNAHWTRKTSGWMERNLSLITTSRRIR